jgi:hypothetical protein
MEPEQATLNNMQDFLLKYINKPEGIEITKKEIAGAGQNSYSFEELKSLETANRSVHDTRSTLSAYVFFAGGDYAENSGGNKVLGIAYGRSSIVMFEKTIQQLSGGIAQPSRSSVESAVLQHEFGHLLGLVDNGSAMEKDHLDGAHGKHCINKKCLMYYAAETSDLVGILLGSAIPSLDADCENDLRANGGK